MSKWVAIPAALACLVALAFFAPFLLKERDLVASTPSPRPMFTVTFIELAGGERLCADDVTIPAAARRLRLQVRTFGRPGPPLDIALDAPGYRERVTTRSGYADTETLSIPIRPPAKDRLGAVCVAPSERIALTGTEEARTLSRPRGRVDGTAIATDAYLAFDEGRRASALSRAAAIIDRMDAFRPGIVGPWVLWPLLALVVLGIPTGTVLALARAEP
jgi:hypothetical protein